MSSGNPLIDAAIPLEVIELIPKCVAQENFILPLDHNENILRVACGRDADENLLARLQWILSVQVVFVPFPEHDVLQAIDFYKNDPTEVSSSL